MRRYTKVERVHKTTFGDKRRVLVTHRRIHDARDRGAEEGVESRHHT